MPPPDRQGKSIFRKNTKRNQPMAKKKYDSIFQIKISLLDSDPLIWRRILVPSNFTLKKLHNVIQIVMGWENGHLHQFLVGEAIYSENEPEFEYEPEVRPTTAKLSKVFSDTKQFIYEYDFGDGWRHEVALEKALKPDDSFHYPICIGGENACPPEDCGGLGGFYSMMEQMENPDDEEHNSTKTWFGGFFDPHSFDPNRINRDMLWAKRW